MMKAKENWVPLFLSDSAFVAIDQEGVDVDTASLSAEVCLALFSRLQLAGAQEANSIGKELLR